MSQPREMDLLIRSHDGNANPDPSCDETTDDISLHSAELF